MKPGVVYRRIAQARIPERMDQERSGNTTAGGQDKRPHIAARSVDWKIWTFLHFAHIAAYPCEVRDGVLSNDLNKNRASRAKRHV